MNQEDLIKQMEENGFIKNNNTKVLEVVESKSAILKGLLTETSLNPYNIAHGGFIFGLGDTAMGVVAASTGRNAVTISSNINYLKPSKGEYLIAKAELIKNGKNRCYLRCDIYNDKEELTATMNGNYFFIN